MLSEYLQNRLRFFFGPYGNRKQNLPAALAELQGSAAAAGRWRFWNGFVTAIHRLQDWHSVTSSVYTSVVGARRTLNACFFEGQGDLSQAQAPSHPSLPDVLVSYTGSDHSWGLSQGDRLVAIDGMHPIEWMRSLVAYDWGYHAANDPNTLSDFTEAIRSSVPRFAKTITVVRCTANGCGAAEQIPIQSIPEDDPNSDFNIVACDHRPSYIVSGGPTDHYMSDNVLGGPVVGTDPSDKIYGMVWDYLLGSGQNDTDIKAQVATWADAKGVVLDHRTGNGGTIQGPEPIIAFVRPAQLFLVNLWRESADDEGPTDQTQGVALFNLYKHDLASAWTAGSAGARTTVPVALLLTRDGSASDYFPFAMKGAPKVKIFGPHGTSGAFSSFVGLSYWGGVNYQLAIEDTIAADGRRCARTG